MMKVHHINNELVCNLQTKYEEVLFLIITEEVNKMLPA